MNRLPILLNIPLKNSDSQWMENPVEERDAIENHNTSKVVEGTNDESKNKDSPSMRFQLSLFLRKI